MQAILSGKAGRKGKLSGVSATLLATHEFDF